MYDCESRSPKIKNLKADGQGQPVTGQNYGALAVQVMDANSIHVTGNKGGKPEFDQTRSASQDGKTLTISSTNYPADRSHLQIRKQVDARFQGTCELKWNLRFVAYSERSAVKDSVQVGLVFPGHQAVSSRPSE